MILASEASAVQQIGALVMFNIVAFALVEVPLVAYVFAPEPTRDAMARLKRLVRRQPQDRSGLTLAIIGCVLLTVGILTS